MEIHVETKEIHMAKLWRYTWRRYGDTHVETKEIHMAKIWRYTWRSYGIHM
jgi:hypothetical protein